jgi:hypothetical protein
MDSLCLIKACELLLKLFVHILLGGFEAYSFETQKVGAHLKLF